MMALGPGDAAVALPVGDLTLSGPLAALLRRAAYAYRMPTDQQRLKAAGSLAVKVLAELASAAAAAASALPR